MHSNKERRALRPAKERGHFAMGWLDTHHTFSFGNYVDPRHMGYRTLRVINEDIVAPGEGFPTHGHRDMEIITYVLSGALEHRDSMGNTARIVPGEIQRMSAGSGVTHSEYNPSSVEPLHLLQIWLLPARSGLTPGYEQKPTGIGAAPNAWRLIASPDGAGQSVRVHQDVKVYAARLTAGAQLTHGVAAGRGAWLQVARGHTAVDGVAMGPGDGLAVDGADTMMLSASTDAEVLLFDMG